MLKKQKLTRQASKPKPIASFDPKKNQFVPKEIFREKEDRAFVRRQQDFFNPKNPMSKQEYESRRLWLRETAETPKDQKNLKKDQERLKRNYEKTKAKKIKPTMPKGPKSPMETGVRPKPPRGNIKPRKKK